MTYDFWVTIHGERGDEWTRILGTSHLPIKSPIPKRALLPNVGETLVYLLAIDQMQPEQVEKIVAHLSAKFNLAPDEAQQEIAIAGIPIWKVDCSVMVHNPQRWL